MNKSSILGRIFCLLVALMPWVSFGEELGENLIQDGGMEAWKETSPDNMSGWNYLAVTCKNFTLSKDDKGNFLTPEILSQFYGAGGLMKMEDKDVHNGKKSLRLKGTFWLNTVPDANKTRAGDEYVVQYWVKGSGETVMNMHVFGEGGAQVVKRTGKPAPGQWTQIEERIQVAGRAPDLMGLLLGTSEEMLIDDVVVRRVIREGDLKLQAISPELTERVAFAGEAGGPIKIDGRLDEPSWAKAIKTGGMRYYQDQTSLAPVPCFFRVLFDDQALYFGIEILQPDCKAIYEKLQKEPLLKADGTPRDKKDSFTGRHSVEIFLQPPEMSRYCQFVISMDGYRYDGAGMDAAWNGGWEYAIQPLDDRWVAEIRIPASDFTLKWLETNTVWRLNLCVNRDNSGSATWAAVGCNFHNPYAFGEMILADFGKWCGVKAAEREGMVKQIRQDAQKLQVSYERRLADIDAYLRGIKAGGEQSLDWEGMIRQYGRLNFADYSYRCIPQEIRYQQYIERERK